MKQEKGITLMSLIIYIVVMAIVLLSLSSIILQFYENKESIQADTAEILECSKFNAYFLKEIKKQNNSIDTISNTYILFKTGNSFSYTNHKIYFNNIEICKNVTNFTIQQDNNDEKVVNITLGFHNFTKTMTYKVEEIY